MDINKIIENKGYNPQTHEKVKVFFPTIVDKNGIASQDEFDEEFAKWIKAFYPDMIKEFGKEETDAFLNEYTYELNVDAVANGRNASGVCYRTEKRIVSNWALQDIHNAVIALLHEAGHCIKIFYGNDDILSAGFLDAESVFSKLDEANVSDRQNTIKNGRYSQKYMNLWDEELNFKTRSVKYQYYQVYLETIRLLLGEYKDLLDKNAKATTREEKDIIYKQIKMNLKNNLKEEQFARLADCLNGLIIHINYPEIPGNMRSKYQNVVVRMQRRTPEEFERMYEKNVQLAKSRGTYDRTINEDVDDLCAVVLEVLKDRLQNPKYNKFECLKQISTYFSMIRNNSSVLKEQTDEILELWKNEVSSININLDCIGSNADNSVSEEDRTVLLNYLLSIEGITIDDLEDTKIIEMPQGVTESNDTQNRVYINVGNKGIFKYFKIPPKVNSKVNMNIISFQGESTEDLFMRGIHFEEVEFLREFPSGETRGELIDNQDNRKRINQAIKDGKKMLTGEFFNQIRLPNERIYGED